MFGSWGRSSWISKDLFNLELDTTFYSILTPRVEELVIGDTALAAEDEIVYNKNGCWQTLFILLMPNGF